MTGRRPGTTRSRTLATTAVFTAFIAAATMAFSVYVPATKGYFNIGDALVYTTALLMGPFVGAFAGGVGSAISDALLAPVYAPGTLVIKGLEGLIVGYLSNLTVGGLTRRRWTELTALMGLVLSAVVVVLGIEFLSGSKVLYLGFSYCNANCSGTSPSSVPIGPQFSGSFYIPSLLWVFVGGFTFLAVMAIGRRTGEKLGWTLVSVLAGGAEMVTGYFLYESFVLNLGMVTASVEIPVNIAQVVVGLLIALPLVRGYRRIAGNRGSLSGGQGRRQE